ncbi:hypothetical protein BV22DRAFT_1126692 [Leucogyrophana mollusca]|uniref:Uncharacterized protein n=1 Tax=Leucogyrophana mollusca TaxID=85980 RepID=A0ACB8BTS5_9AGAM|nr:hypothetical protein BV22DRAFT_1126692 [Leucogyrophana mollusca]
MDHEEQSNTTQGLLAPSPEFLASLKVFPLIPYLKKDVINTVDSPLSWEQLTAADINFAIVRPLVHKYARLRNMAVIYACLVVRSFFLSQSGSNLAHSAVMFSRATLCEVLALKLLTSFASNKIQLVAVLTTSWNPLAGAPLDIVAEVNEATRIEEGDLDNGGQSAIEMAIATKSKAFLASPIVQSVVNDIYAGCIVFSIAGNRAMVADNYKPRAIEIYDTRTAPVLDHYRLRVPRYSAILHFLNFAVLLLTFIACLWTQDLDKISLWEAAFLVFATAFTLQEYTATKEHGWIIYIANIWNVFDSSFVLIFLAYIGLRIRGLLSDDADTAQLAFDLLACGACILVPRLAFYAISNNVVVLALRAMISEFVFFIGIAAICFSGLLLTLYTLASGGWSVRAIAWLMVQIWFGNTYLSFGQATSFHPVFGPILMTCFAALSNTLLLTILISILSNTVARIDANANQEYLFQYTISTIEGVKSDALFSYQPPFNLLAFVILKPASYILSPRALHSANVFLIRLTSFPILIIIAIYERHLATGQRLRETGKDAAHSLYHSLPRHIKNIPLIEYLVGSKAADLYEAIFDVEESRDFDLFDESEFEEDTLSSPAIRSHVGIDAFSSNRAPKRYKSSTSLGVDLSPSRSRKVSTLTPLAETSSTANILSLDTSTALARLYNQGSKPHLQPLPFLHGPSMGEGIEADPKGRETVGDSRDPYTRRLIGEMKELQDRQARIESLLLTLTRSMPNDANGRR